MIARKDISLKKLQLNPQNLIFSIVMGVIALIINFYPIPFFANVQFVLGNTLTVIVAILCGPWYALATSLLASTSLMLTWDTYHVFFIFGLEALFLGFCRRKDIYALYGNIIFWLVIGMPIFYLMVKLFLAMPTEHLSFVTIKQAINSLIYTSIASLLVLMIPKLWMFETKIKDKQRRSLSKQMTYFVTLMITLSLLFSTLYFNYISLDKQQSLITKNQQETVFHLSNAGEQYIDNHQKVIENAARYFSIANESPQELQALLSNLHKSYPGFISMLVTDSQSKIIATSPASRLNNAKNKNIIVKDRDYFIEAFYNQRVFVSSVFLGRGFGTDPIIAISAPYYSKQNTTQPLGIIEASLDLKYFSAIDSDFSQQRNQSLILTDETNNIIYASDTLNLNVMSPFKYSIHNGLYLTKLPLMNITDTGSRIPEYIYAQKQLKNGWKVYIIEPFSPLLQLAEQQMQTSFLMLLGALFVSFFISNRISQLLTIPLEIVANQFGHLSQHDLNSQTLDDSYPKEVYSLYQRLLTSKQQLITQQFKLEETVVDRTQELEKANKKLKELVDKDPLTKLFNRRFAELKFHDVREFCLRNEQAITVAILDLDFFKTVNDSYGHLAGDECLRQVSAQLSQHFKRDIDILARYGGEEFILILPMSNALHIEHHLNEFRVKLSQMTINTPDGTKTFDITASIGAITANANFDTKLDKWIKIADDNLYQAKAQGRNRTIVTIINPEVES
ncbi:diguanylate cyclase [Shewanella sp. OMA3-2]|uniref:diguanylate cyclase n=1 Tax=Shewanella sp. OMA3-2 TaxID=2908650 RepID=UPI001F22E4AE|nr:diguanylate cyclase [Shewanella sp. OMA3-2]UJF23314.1 diguanylate cyclase [Shewanella sp. OMA3-2]